MLLRIQTSIAALERILAVSCEINLVTQQPYP